VNAAFAPAVANGIRAEVDRRSSAAAHLPAIAIQALHDRAIGRAAEIGGDARSRCGGRGRGTRGKRKEKREHDEEAGQHPTRARAILVHTSEGLFFRPPQEPRGLGATSPSQFAASGARGQEHLQDVTFASLSASVRRASVQRLSPSPVILQSAPTARRIEASARQELAQASPLGRSTFGDGPGEGAGVEEGFDSCAGVDDVAPLPAAGAPLSSACARAIASCASCTVFGSDSSRFVASAGDCGSAEGAFGGA
jgi:hypothetical protein